MTIRSEDNQEELLDFIEQNLETGPSGQAIVGIGCLVSGHILPVQTWIGEK